MPDTLEVHAHRPDTLCAAFASGDAADRWPKMRIEVLTGTCVQIRDSVAAGRSDLGLVIETDTGAADDSILAKARLVIFGSPAHPLARGGASPEPLHACDLYMSDAAGDYHQLLRQYFEAAQIPPPKTEVLGSIEGVKRGVLARTSALGLLPVYALKQDLRNGVLAGIGINPPLRGLVLRAVFANGNSNSPPAEDLLQSLRGVALTEKIGAA